MDLLFCGITDIIIVLLIIIFSIIGLKHGLIKKLLSLASWIVALILSFIFVSAFKDMLINHDIIYPSIFENIMNNLEQTKAFSNPDATLDIFLQELGLPSFISNMIAADSALTSAEIATNIATSLATMFMTIISFLILFFGILLLSKIFKLIVHLLRENLKFIKVLDGILGFFGYIFFAFVTIFILLFVVSILFQIPVFDPFKEFMIKDMQLNTHKFRLSKYLYENNILLNFFKLFF